MKWKLLVPDENGDPVRQEGRYVNSIQRQKDNTAWRSLMGLQPPSSIEDEKANRKIASKLRTETVFPLNLGFFFSYHLGWRTDASQRGSLEALEGEGSCSF
ncbi:MAG TPA: hypothetical protein VHA52_08535 [Candidatus Babeliaceae bacterium]|nr:hypothetical protein [Candidatus Babeliaceae bacterium]